MSDENFEGEESFADLLEESLAGQRAVAPGEKVTGTVVQVGSNRALLDLGGGVDGMIELGEIAGENRPPPSPGDRIEAWVVRVENRVAVLTLSLGRGPGARRALEEAAETGLPVEGLVAETNKGGYVVEVGGVRCFCPLAQMDLRRVEDPASLVGQRLTFQVMEFRGGRDVVLSRRALLEAEAAEKAEATRRRLEPGARFSGTVTSVRDFGVFVDIGGIEGLVPQSELGWARRRPDEAVQPGQTVEVEVLEIKPPTKDTPERISLSMRAIEADPWEAMREALEPGMVLRGTVSRLQPFGAFVELAPGVDGLVHVSAFGRPVKHPAEVVTPGARIAVRVDAVDIDGRRISLGYVDEAVLASLTPVASEAAAPPEVAPPPAPAPSPARPPAAAKGPASGPGLKVRRAAKAPEPAKPVPPPPPAEKVAAPPPAPVPTPAPTGLAVLGRMEPVAPSAEAAAPTRRRPEELPAPPVGSVLDVTVDRIESFGLFVTWPGGRGLLPASELETARPGDIKRSYPVGTSLRVAVVEVRPDGKVRLSKRAAAEAEERAEAQQWLRERQPKASGKGFGTLGDLLRDKLKK